MPEKIYKRSFEVGLLYRKYVRNQLAELAWKNKNFEWHETRGILDSVFYF